MDKIDRFEGKYRFLSNFSSHRVTYNGLTYRNAEAAFHAQKCPSLAEEFTGLSPGAAKHFGRSAPLRIDWEEVKDCFMLQILRCKFKQNPGLKTLLLDTGDAELEEGNTWGDRYWGTVNGKGLNKLGKLLMKVRDEIREETEL